MNKFRNICFKSLNDKNVDTPNDGKTYTAVVYTNEVDRENEQGTHEFLEGLAQMLVDKPVTKNHAWEDVDSIVGRVVSSSVVTEGDSGVEYVEVEIHVVNDDAIEKIENGLYKGLSVGFEAEKNDGDNGVTLLTRCTDAYEISFVTVPCVPNASIKLKSFIMKGDTCVMKFKDFKISRLLTKHPELKSLPSDTLDELVTDTDDVEVTEDDVKAILEENAKYCEKIKELETELAGYKELESKTKSESLILDVAEKAVDELEPCPDAKEVIMDDVKEAIEKGDLIVEHLPDGEACEEHIAEENIKGLTDFIEKTKTKYTKLKMLGYKASDAEVDTVDTKTVDTVVKSASKSVKFSTNGLEGGVETKTVSPVPSKRVTFK